MVGFAGIGGVNSSSFHSPCSSIFHFVFRLWFVFIKRESEIC